MQKHNLLEKYNLKELEALGNKKELEKTEHNYSKLK